MEEPERQSRPFAVGEIARRMLEPGIPGEGAAGEPRETAGRDRAEDQRHRLGIRVPSGEAARPVPDAEAAQRLDHGHALAQDRKIVVPVGVPADQDGGKARSGTGPSEPDLRRSRARRYQAGCCNRFGLSDRLFGTGPTSRATTRATDRLP